MPRQFAVLLSLIVTGAALVPATAHADEHRTCEHRKVVRLCGYRGHGTPIIRPITALHGCDWRTVTTGTAPPCAAPCARGEKVEACSAVVTVKARRLRRTTFEEYRLVEDGDLDLAALDAETFDELPDAPG